MRTRALAVLAMLALTALPAAAAVTNEFTAYDGAQLGSTPEQVRKAFPKMQVTTENLGSQPFPSEHLVRYAVPDAKIGEAGATGVLELRFWNNKLWAVIAYYPPDKKDAVVAALTKRLGPPTGTNPAKPSWEGAKSGVFVETSMNWFAITDNALSKEAQAWFLANLQKMSQAMQQGQARQQAQAAAATPAAAGAAATPAAATPAATPAAPPAK